MTLNPVIIEILKDNVSQLDNVDIDIVLALLHKRKCEISDKVCLNCSWCGSDLCLPIRQYLKIQCEENENEQV